MARVHMSGIGCALWVSETVDREHVTGRPAAVKMRSSSCMCLAVSARQTLTKRSVRAGSRGSRPMREHGPSLQETTDLSEPLSNQLASSLLQYAYRY